MPRGVYDRTKAKKAAKKTAKKRAARGAPETLSARLMRIQRDLADLRSDVDEAERVHALVRAAVNGRKRASRRTGPQG